MRFIVRFFAFVCFFLLGYKAQANHVLGGNLTWDCLGGNQYTITLRIYKDCFGASSALSAENLFIYPTGCASLPQNITLNLTSTTEISNLCASELPSSSCNGGLTPGTQMLIYTATVTLDPGCTWEVIWNEGDWNYFNNITYTSLPDAYISALINTNYCADSPVITSMQVPYQCRNNGVFTHVPTLSLPAGVTASFALSTPQTTGASIDASINVPGYVNTLGATVNAATGAVSINTNGVAVGNYIVTIEITLTQGGNVIGTYYENMVFVIRDCATTPTTFANPEIQSINIPAIQGGPATINACVGDNVCFTVSASNTNLYRAITITSTWSAGLNVGTPVFTQSTTNYNPASGTFCFTANASMVGTPQTINFVAIDNACSAPQSDNQTVTVNVFPSISLTPVTATICANTPITATASGGSSYTWSVLSGDATPGFDGNAAVQVLESISSNTVIVATLPGVPAQCDASDTLTVTVTSVSVQPLTTQTMCVGGVSTALSFTLLNTSGTLTYQWYSNTTNTNTGGTLIVGATAATYTPPTTTAGTLYYYCVISMSSGGCPSIATNAAEVIVAPDPTISTQPTAVQTICVGGTGVMSVAYTSGLGTATYQWYTNTTNSNTGGTLIAGATNSTYTTPVLNTVGTRYYYCVVTLSGSGCGSVSSAVAQVVVVADPTISTQPLNTQTLCLGAVPTTLSVTAANGTGTITYQWYSNTANNTATGTLIPGATNSTYIPPTNTVGTRYYYCRVTASGAGCGFATTTTAAVIVNALPTISTQPTATQSICIGGTPSALTVAYTGGAGTPSYQWYSNTTNSNSGGTIVPGATTASYTGSGAVLGTFYYYCTVTLSGNGCGSVTSNVAVINVVADPVVATQPTTTQTICAGGQPTALTFTFSNGTGTPLYQWFTNSTPTSVGGVAVGGAVSATYTPPVLNTPGNYYYYGLVAVMGSGCGTLTTNSATVVVVADPSIGTQPTATQSICVGGTPTALTVVPAGGTGTFSYQWYSSTTNTNTGGAIIPGATAATYTPVVPAIIGNYYYYCTVSANGPGCGSTTSAVATISVIAGASVTTQPTVTQTICNGGDSSNLTVAASGGGGTYNYQWYSNTTNSSSGGTSITGATASSFTATALAAGTYYYYCEIIPTASGCGSVLSSTATIVVIADPTITTQPTATQTICVGGTPSALTLAYSGGTGTATYQWYSNTTNATTGGTLIAGATSSTYAPAAINTAGSYYYYGEATLSGSGCGSATSASAEVVVIADPTITTQPLTTQTVCAGGTATALTIVSTGGTGTTTYQWYSNTTNATTGGTLIAGATTDTYTPTATAAGTTYYYNIATISGSGCGTATSATGAVIVVTSPTITTQPTATQTVCQNGTTTALTLAYSGGTGTPSYQWYSNASNSTVGGTAIAGETNATFTPPAATVGTTYYYCELTLSGSGCTSSTTATAEVIVNALPTITTQPTATQTICVGGTPSALTLAYSGGTGTATYQWYSNTTNATTGGTLIAGATSSTYAPAAINTAGSYYYYGEATLSGSGCGSATSASAEVVVIADPTITTQPLTTQTVCAGGTATALTIVSTGGTGTTTYQWYSNTTNATTGGTLIAGATTDTYTPTATAAGTTYYYNIATISGSGCGTATSATGAVIVVTSPTITTQPTATQTVCQNGTTTALTLAYSGGTGTPSYQWYSNASNSTAGGTAIAGETNATFTPPAATVGTTYYYCILTLSGSGCTSSTTATAEVIVNALPTITTQPTATQTICVGGTPSALTLAYSGGTGTATYQWYSNTTNATTGGTLIAGATSSTYAPAAINTAGSYYYYGEATLSGSGCGSATSASAEVVVIADPTITTQPLTTQTVCAGGTATALTVVSTGGTGTTTYQWYSNTTNATTGGTLIAGATTDTYTPTATAAGTTYYYNIATISGSGCGTATSATGAVIVVTSPTITTQPTATQTVCQNGTTTALTLAYSGGTGTPSYQWYSNASNSTVGGTAIAGETNATFTPPAATVGTTYYYCELTLSGSGCTSSTTATAEVIVNALPTITTQPTATQTICVGGTPSALTLAYSGGTGTATYQWYSNTTNATTGGTLIAGATSSTYAPAAINTAGSYYYYGEATLSGSGCGSATSASAEVVVIADPTITTQPLTTQTVCAGGTATALTIVSTGGTGTTTYQWYSNTTNATTGGTLIAGATTDTYTPTATAAGTTYYYNIATISGSGCGTATSATGAVIVVTSPTITTQPTATQTVCQNGTTTALTLAYSGGTGTPSYQWYSNASNSTAGGTAIAGETNATFTPPAATVGTTYYYCILTLSGSGCTSSTTATAEVIVNALPTITTQPTATQTICVGGTPSALTLAYSGGTGTATYQWYSNTTNATTGGTLIAGATSSTYAPAAINTAGSYYYYGEATLSGSGCGSATSASAEVVVIADPTITTQPLTTQTVCAGGTATALTVVSTGGTGTTTYQWYSNTTNATTGGTLIAGATTDTYTPTATAAGTTYYYNIATISGSGCGTATSATGAVIVVTSPTITTQPTATQTVCQNGTTTALTLAYSGGTGTPSYQWYSNASNSTVGGTAIAGETNATFTPPAATVGTTYYYCILTLSGSGCGTATTNVATVNVLALPTITTQPTATQTICVGGTPSALTLAYSGGTGTATYQWYSNTTNATTGGTLIAGATSSTYAPAAINTAGSYYYYGEATLSGSGCGSATSASAEVVVIADPTITTQPLTTQTVCAGGTATALTIVSTGGTGTTTYQWYSNTTNATTGGTLIAGATTDTYTPTATAAGTTYYYNIATISGSGCGTATSATGAVIVVTSPTITTQPTATQTVCQNGTTTALTLAYSGGTGTPSYQWYSNASNSTVGGTAIAGETNATFTPPAATVGTTYYYCELTLSGSGCTSSTTATAEVIVNALPTITTQPTATQTICVGGTPSALTLAYSGGTGTATYQWYSNTTNATTGGTLIAGATSSTYAPAAINTAGSYYYYGEATLSGSGCGSATSASAEVVVIADPTITTQPLTTQTVCAGGTATALTIVSTGGTGTTTYQWYSNTTNATTGGTLIAGATTDTYTPTATAAGTTYYYNIATISGSGCGTATSATGAVIVVTSPTITTQPTATQTVCQNGTTTALTLAYSGGTGTPSYQWYSNASNSTVGGTAIAGETNATFTPPAATVGTTYYYCILTLSGSGCGTATTNVATVNVLALPTITTQPTATQTICVGGTPSALTLAYSGGTGTATYQWYSNTTNATTGGTLIAGATSSTYAPAAINTAGSYYYYGEATLSGSGCGSATSASAEVVVVADPSITVQPLTTQTVCQNGLSTPLTVTVTGGTGTTTYQWFTNPINSNVGGFASGNAATLTPITAVVGTAYVYCVINTTGVGCTSSASTTAEVIVVPIPTVTTQPLNTQTVCLNGATAALSFVYSNGTGTATYQWYSNAANSTTGGTAIAGETNASFTPPSATAGTTYYYCIATLSGSGCGTVTTATAAVIVVGLPTITAQPTVTQNICEGGTANPIAVSYSNGTGTASYQWFSNNSNATVGGIAIPGATADQYTIPSITLAGSYFYYAEITLSGSGCGTIASAASEVVVFLDPSVATEPLTTQSLCVNGAPTDLQVTFNNGAGTATYQWYSNNTNSNTGGVIIPSANNASYTPSTANSGTQYFYCEILLTGSGCELATSAAAEVVVVGLPTVSSQAISNETVCVDGTPSTLTPTLQGGTGTVSYQWYSNTTNDTTNGTTISGETNATYSPSATAVGDTYYYLITTFSGTNCGSVTTNTSQVLVVADPTISIQPIATDSLCVGGTPVTLNVAVSGGVGSPSYQWYSNTVNSNAGGTAVAGAGLDAFTPSSTSTVGSEFYYAEVTLSGSGCDAVSTTVSEIVSVADPIISTQPITTQNECLNAPTTALNATVSGGLGTISYAWYSNTTAVASGAIIPGANTNTVTPANTPVGTTYYYMVATLTGNGCDAAVSDFAEVMVNPLPNLTVTPVQDSICFGATTDVVASGAVDYVWTADPSITSPTDVAIVTVAPTGSVTYTVQGTDAVGCVNTASGVVFAATSLTVQEVITTDICFETCTGAIDLTPAGSIPNYSILWTDPAITGFTPQNLCPSTYDYTVTDALGCTYQNAVVISSLPNNPLDNAIVTQPTCFGFTNGSIEFVDTDAVSFELVNAATSASLATQPTGLFGNLGAGNYNVIYEDALGCVYDSLNFAVVELSAELTLTLNAQNPTLCYNEVVPLTAIAGGGDGGALTITWGSCNTVTNCIEGTGNPFDYTITSDVTLYAQASDANGCTSSIESIALNLTDPISVQMQNGISSVSICDGECVNMTAAASGGSSSPITIEWYEVPTAVGGTTIGPNGTSNSYCPTNTTSVFVYANDGCAVPAYDTLNITVFPLPNVGFTVNEQEGCAPVTVSFTNTTSAALSANCIWTMDDGTTIPACGNQVYTYSEVGTYSPSLYVISADGCSATYTIPAPIEVYGYPTAEFTWAPEPADVLNPIVNFSNGSTDAVGYYWDFGPYGASIDENPIFTFPDEDLAEFPVCLTVSNEFGCTDTACRTVTMNSVLQVWVPNAFTPEQDGLNEVFLPIIQGANPAGYHFMIFDRWGTLVFESFDIGTPWIGDIRGGKGFAPDGTYVWRLEVEHLADRRLGVYTGFVTLIR